MGVEDEDALRRNPPETPSEAQDRGLLRLRRALLKRKEHAAHAAAWRDVDSRNHFAPAIESAMRIGRDRNADR